MKRLFIYLTFFFTLTDAFAQDKGYRVGFWGACDQHPVVVANKQLESGARWIEGSRFISTAKNSSLRDGDKLDCNIGLSAEKTFSDTLVYYIDILLSTAHLGYLNLYKDSPLLIKLENDEVIRLKCREDVEDRAGSLMSARFNVWLYTVVAQYEISSDDIDRFADGVKKIRLEANAERWDFEFKRFKKDELGEYLYKEKAVITEALEAQTDFDEDF